MKRADEELCKEQFNTFLGRYFASSEIIWEEVAQRDEPPDYYLILGGARFAVEVTTLLEKVPIGNGMELPLSVISKTLQDFVAEVDATARAEGVLSGNYLVVFPMPIDDFTDVRDEISRKLLDYIRSTVDLEKFPSATVFERIISSRERQQCRIHKTDNKLDRVVSGGPWLMKWEDKAVMGFCKLLDESLNTKVYKLRKIMTPKILLLLDEYVFTNQEMFEKCIPWIPLVESFHTVFIVQYDKDGFVVYSQCDDWLKL